MMRRKGDSLRACGFGFGGVKSVTNGLDSSKPGWQPARSGDRRRNRSHLSDQAAEVKQLPKDLPGEERQPERRRDDCKKRKADEVDAQEAKSASHTRGCFSLSEQACHAVPGKCRDTKDRRSEVNRTLRGCRFEAVHSDSRVPREKSCLAGAWRLRAFTRAT